MSPRSLEDLLGTVGSPVELLRNSQTGANVFPGVPPEFTNWRDEQRAWQTTCLLFDQSFPQLASPHLHSTEYLLCPGPLRRRQYEPVGQFENMSRTRITVELGRLRESHALAVDVAGNVLLRKRFDFARLLPGIR